MKKEIIIESYSFWKAIQEAEDNGTLVMTFGRFNPPTIGHQCLFQTMLNTATRERGTALVFASHSQDAKKNPLPYEEKCGFIQKILPKGIKLVRTAARNMIQILRELKERKFRKLILIVGDDRTDEKIGFGWIDKTKEEFGFNDVKLVSAGARSGSSKLQNASATAMRNAAKEDNYESFVELSPFDATTTKKLFERLKALLK